MRQVVSNVFDLRRYRWPELFLLILPGIFILMGIVQLQLVALKNSGQGPSTVTANSLPTVDLVGPQLLLIIALLATHFALSWIIPDADQIILPIVGMLAALGVMMATRLGPVIGAASLGYRQLTWVIVGMGFLIGTVWATRNLRWLRRYKYTWALTGLGLVAISLGNAFRTKNFDSPTHDQLNIGPAGLAFQPSELLKICIVIFYAAYLAENRDMLAMQGTKIGPLYFPPLKHMGPLLVLLGVALLMFLGLRELGVALLIFGVFVSMIYLASGRLAYVFYSLIGFAGGGYIAYRLLSYVRDRISIVTICDPVTCPPVIASGKGYQVTQGLIAIASGGILGQGFGQGHPGFVPAVQTDFVAAAIGEEFGMAGLFAVLALFMILIYRGFRIAVRSKDTFEQLLAGGISSIFAIQTLVILAGNLKIIPLTGIPLPFITYGGSSVIANCIMVGLLLRLSAPEDN